MNGNILIAGATGALGSQIARQLAADARTRPRALVRSTSDARRRLALRDSGVGLIYGDLKDRPSLLAACDGAACVVSTATAMLSRQPGDDIQSVDEAGQLALIDAAEQTGVERFVFASFAPLHVDCALQRAKQVVEQRLRNSSMAFTILRPVNLIEIWLGPLLGFSAATGPAPIFGSGDNPTDWVSLHDVARFAVSAAIDGLFARETLDLAGPDALSQRQVLEIFRELGATATELETVSETDLRDQLARSRNPIEESFATLLLNTALGYRVAENHSFRLPGQLSTVRSFARALLRELKNASAEPASDRSE